MMDLSAQSGVPQTLPEGVGHPRLYFVRRGTVLDCSGPLVIHGESHWGYLVTVLTRSHDIHQGPGHLGPAIDRGVRVEAGAWICSGALLQSCHIGEGAIVAAGAVVRGQDVAPGVIVAGNPARVIARWQGGHWAYLPEEETGFYRRLA
jgi:acetyltransferase-like isoleucine patch superfamily enzyme